MIIDRTTAKKQNMVKLFVRKGILCLVSIIVLMGGCKKTEPDYEAIEIEKIKEFMNLRGYDITPKPSGLYFKDIIVGDGDLVQALDTVGVYYSGYFLSGIQFDSNVGSAEPFIFVVQDDQQSWVINGFDEALTYMREGGESLVIIPSWLAYGTTGSSSIPGYTPIIFELELVSIKPGPGSN